ncbi:hypothetical protein [Cystobacter fuscus]|uniref:hypothetical protein n=1 Tax=Cystobacter fuscus TaxID=43 RepID=UPI0012DC2E2D|nr:hypothetical protein [Cystobacter fuscus]
MAEWSMDVSPALIQDVWEFCIRGEKQPDSKYFRQFTTTVLDSDSPSENEVWFDPDAR